MTTLSSLLDAAPGGFLGGSGQMLLMMAALFGIMYFFMIRPQQKKQKAIQEARSAIKVGSKIVTAGGIHGKVKEVNEDNFIIEIAENTKVKVEKSSVFASAEDSQQK